MQEHSLQQKRMLLVQGMLLAGKDPISDGVSLRHPKSNPFRLLTNLSVLSSFFQMNPTDLTQRPPRSPRVKLGGLVLLPRMLDKGRAHLAGTVGEYHFNCPLDQRVATFLGVNADDVLKLLKDGKSDSEILAWIRDNTKRSDFEIYQWSEYQMQRAPSDIEGREYVSGMVKNVAPDRDDVVTWFDMLDLDDYASFGGKA
jgi:Domain of unknown function (DUF5069)